MSSADATEKFLRLLQAHKGIVYKVAGAYCRDAENRKDLIQEIILQWWLSFHRYDETYKLSTWLYRIALNVSISFYRKENRRTLAYPRLPDTLLYLPDDSDGETDFRLQALQGFIRELPEPDRAILLLYLEQNTHREIAEILGMSPTNVSTRIARIKQRLKEKFEKLQNA